MLSIQSSQNFNKNSRPNFKSHIVETDLYQKGLQFAKNNMHPNKDMKKGIEFVKAAEGIRNDKKYDFVGFYKSRNNVYTKINGKIVDFGGLIETDTEDLRNPAIRKLIRIILKHINYQFDSNIFQAKWEINEANLNSLKTYIIRWETL